MIVEVIRMAFLVIVLLGTILYQIVNAKFVSYDVFLGIYLLLLTSFLLNLFYSLNLEKFLHVWYVSAILFVWETIYITLLIYFMGINQSLLVFLYLINIILCGVVFQRSGGLYLALFTSVCFSLLLAADQRIQGNSLYFAVGINNLAFFTVAYLSGYLSEQLNFMGLELRERGRDIRLLKNLNAMVLDNMASGLLTLDNFGKILQYNENAIKILGLEKIQIGEENPLFTKDLTTHLGNDSASGFDLDFEAEDEKKILRIHISVLNDGFGEKLGFVVVFEDITNLKKLEQRVQQSEKMAAVGQLAAGIAHEIRNPLASISGSVELLQSDSSRTEDEKKLMNIVIREIDRLNKLITEFLDYARPQDVRLSEIDLSQLVLEMIHDLSYLPGFDKIELVQNITPHIKVQGHRDKLKQAFLNIFMNAIQALEKKPLQKMIVSLSVTEGKIVLTIEDTGVGIDPKIIKKIFEPFLTTKSKGTGLGLAVVHSILSAHSANIDVTSVVGEGTQFKMEFPR